MKSFIYLIITIIISITLTSSLQTTSERARKIMLQSTGNNVTPALLKESADIISARLNLYGIRLTEINVSSEKRQISVQLADDIEISEIEELLTSPGQLSFFETYTREEIASILKPGNKLFELLKSDQVKSSADPRVGCINAGNRKEADEYLRSMRPVDNCKLSWGIAKEKSEYCLFALKSHALLVRSDFDTIKSDVSSGSGIRVTRFRLNPSAARIFAEATKINLDKAIAIVIDDQVFYWPIVRNVIDGGNLEVTGNLSEKDVNYFLALVNSGILPLSFTLVK
jgi:preprotein translocase subunit SecD